MKELIDYTLHEMIQGPEQSNIKFGFDFLDDVAASTYRYGLTIIAGEVQIGKTAFVLNVVKNILQQKGSVLYISNRDTNKDIIRKLIGICAQVNPSHDGEYTEGEIADLQVASELLGHSNFALEYAHGESIEHVYRRATNELKKWDLIIVDDIQGFCGDKFSEGVFVLRRLAWECGCPIWALTNEKRAIKTVLGKNSLSMNRKNMLARRAILQNNLMFLTRDDYYRMPGQHDNTAKIMLKTRRMNGHFFTVENRLNVDMNTLRYWE